MLEVEFDIIIRLIFLMNNQIIDDLDLHAQNPDFI